MPADHRNPALAADEAVAEIRRRFNALEDYLGEVLAEHRLKDEALAALDKAALLAQYSWLVAGGVSAPQTPPEESAPSPPTTADSESDPETRTPAPPKRGKRRSAGKK